MQIHRSTLDNRGYHNLLVAMILSAIDELSAAYTHKTDINRHKQTALETMHWLMSEKETYALSFRSVCSMLSLPIEQTRAYILSEVERRRNKGGRAPQRRAVRVNRKQGMPHNQEDLLLHL